MAEERKKEQRLLSADEVLLALAAISNQTFTDLDHSTEIILSAILLKMNSIRKLKGTKPEERRVVGQLNSLLSKGKDVSFALGINHMKRSADVVYQAGLLESRAQTAKNLNRMVKPTDYDAQLDVLSKRLSAVALDPEMSGQALDSVPVFEDISPADIFHGVAGDTIGKAGRQEAVRMKGDHTLVSIHATHPGACNWCMQLELWGSTATEGHRGCKCGKKTVVAYKSRLPTVVGVYGIPVPDHVSSFAAKKEEDELREMGL